MANPQDELAELRAAVAAALPPPSDASVSAGAENTARAFRNAALKVASDHPELLGTPGWGELAAYVAGAGRGG